MADLKTTAEERARLREDSAPSGLHGRPSARTIRVLDDLDTLLAENAKLDGFANAWHDAMKAVIPSLKRGNKERDAVIVAAKALASCYDRNGNPKCDYGPSLAQLRRYLAALEAP